VNDIDLDSLRKAVRDRQNQANSPVGNPNVQNEQTAEGRRKRTTKVVLLVVGFLLTGATVAAVAWNMSLRSSREEAQSFEQSQEIVSETSGLSNISFPTITRLSVASDVTVAQRLINSFVSPVAVDGRWGPQTDDGVARLRAELGLSDGVSIDEEVWTAALSYLEQNLAESGKRDRPQRSLQSISVPGTVLLMQVQEDGAQTKLWRYAAPDGLNLLDLQLLMGELNPEETLGGWKFCRSLTATNGRPMARSWWAYPDRRLSFEVDDQDGFVSLAVTEERGVLLTMCSTYKQ
jgi:hypothetical protein